MNERKAKSVIGVSQRPFITVFYLPLLWSLAFGLALLINISIQLMLTKLVPHEPLLFATPGVSAIHGANFERAQLALSITLLLSLLCSMLLDRYTLMAIAQNIITPRCLAKDGFESSKTILGQNTPSLFILATSMPIVLTIFLFQYWYHRINDIWVYYVFYGLGWDPIYLGWKYLLVVGMLAVGYVVIVEPFRIPALLIGLSIQDRGKAHNGVLRRRSFLTPLFLLFAIRATVYSVIFLILLWFASAPVIPSAGSWFWFLEKMETGYWWLRPQTPCMATTSLIVLAMILVVFSRTLRRNYSGSK